MTNNNNHPITPSPELVEEWANASARTYRENGTHVQHEFAIATQAARWGADTELEAVLMWLRAHHFRFTNDVYAARRSKPPSLKEQALALLDDASDRLDAVHENTIRRALESLPS